MVTRATKTKRIGDDHFTEAVTGTFWGRFHLWYLMDQISAQLETVLFHRIGSRRRGSLETGSQFHWNGVLSKDRELIARHFRGRACLQTKGTMVSAIFKTFCLLGKKRTKTNSRSWQPKGSGHLMTDSLSHRSSKWVSLWVGLWIWILLVHSTIRVQGWRQPMRTSQGLEGHEPRPRSTLCHATQHLCHVMHVNKCELSFTYIYILWILLAAIGAS